MSADEQQLVQGGDVRSEDMLICGTCRDTFEKDQPERCYNDDQCVVCSKKHRRVLENTSEPDAKKWFSGLRKSDPLGYVKVLNAADKCKTKSGGSACLRD